MRRITAVLAGIVMLLPAGAKAADPACDWRMYGNDLGHSFAASPGCSDITPLNLATMHAKWFMPTPAPVTAQPAVVDGVVYVGSADGTFYALDADSVGTPNVRWTFSVTDTNLNSYGTIVSSATVDDIGGKRVVIFAGGATIYILDAATGTKLASACLDPRTTFEAGQGPCQGSSRIIEVESSPAVVHEDNGDVSLYTGMDFNEGRVARAGLIRFKINANPWSLQALWKFDPETQLSYTIDDTKDGVDGFAFTSNPLTYGGTGTGCANVWSSAAIDRVHEQVYFGVANCGRVLNPGEFGGEGTIALDRFTGKMIWRHIQRPNNPSSDPDYDVGASPQLLPGDRVGEAGKDGTYYAYPATGTGTPAWSSHVVSGSDIGGMIGSSALGASTPLGSTEAVPAIFASSAVPINTQGDYSQGSFEEIIGDPTHAFVLHAINALTGELLWHAANPLPSYAAVTYANGLVYLSDTFGLRLDVYDANTGAMLWTHPLNGAPSSGPALVGDSIYLGTGTAADPVSFVGQAAGIWSFQAVPLP
jgi:outer membrane protein assembly factor BamB